MILCNNAASMQTPRERGVLIMAGRHEPPDVETWCAEIAAEIGLIQNCLDYITHLSPILFRYSIVLVF